VTEADGTCDWLPTTPAPQIGLSPGVVLPDPAQGTTADLTARLVNVAAPEGTPVFFTVSGVNAASKMVRADASGTAVLHFAGLHDGDDVVTAGATVGTASLQSDPARVTWMPGKHATEVNLNLTPEGGSGGRRTFAIAGLFDVSLGEAAVSGAPLHFDLAGATCDATTDASGMATCDLFAPNAASTLTVSYAGDATHLAATASLLYTIFGGGLPFGDGFEIGLCAWPAFAAAAATCH
jgi:hypothetical protein